MNQETLQDNNPEQL